MALTTLGLSSTAPVTVRDAVLSLLRSFRLTTIFGNPGSTELPMFRDFPPDFRYVLGLQESVVLAMADGYAQATRNAALVNLHSAAGVGHALGSLFTAYRNQTPLVVTAGQQARSMLPFDPYLFAQQATEFPRPYVKWACEPARAEDVPAAIARAYYVAMQAPRGPTFVSIPVDDWDRGAELLTPREVNECVRGDPALIAEVGQALGAAVNPVIVVGAAVARDDAWHETVALAERHEAPVWVAPMSSRNSFPEGHRLFAGFLPANRQAIVEHLCAHDLILVLGAPVFLYHTEGRGPVIPAGSRLMMLVDDPMSAAWAPVGTAVVTNLKYGVLELLEAPSPVPRPLVRPRAQPRQLDQRVLTDALLLEHIATLRPRGAIVVEEAPGSRAAMHDHLPMLEKDAFYTCASGGLGHGLPAAVGVALGRPDCKIIAVIGDGSSMYAIQGLWSAAQLDLGITFVIINNRSYAALEGFSRHFGMVNTVGTKLPGIDFCALARGHGIAATRVESVESLDAALSAAFSSSEPSLLEIMVENKA